MNEGFGDWTTGEPTKGAGRGGNILNLAPLVSIAVLVLLITAVIWIVRSDTSAQTQKTLVSDSLWVEEALRFQLSSHEEMLLRAAFEAAKPDRDIAAILARARVHLAANPEMLRVVWFDARGVPFLAVPAAPDAPASLAQLSAQARSATSSMEPQYLTPVATANDGLSVDIVVRMADGNGFVVGTVSLSKLLDRHVPWWIAEKYVVRLVGPDGALLAEKARVEPSNPDLRQVVDFDPPLPGVSMLVAPYKIDFDLSSILLPAGIIGAALLAALSLVVQQRQAMRRERAETDLATEIAFRHSMEDSLTVGLRAKDHDGTVLYVNTAFCNMVGYPAADLVGKGPPMPFWLEDIHALNLQRQEMSGQGKPQPQSFETRFRRRDGREIDVQVYEAPLIDGRGRHRGWMGSFIDVTEQKRASDVARLHAQTLQRTGRLVTMGEMASTLAHELNQPLSAVASYATGALNLLNSGRAAPEQLIPAMEKLAVQADRAGQIIRRIQDFTRKRDPRFEDIALDRVIRDTCEFLAADAREHKVQLVQRLQRNLPPVHADAILMEQVLANLIRNGIEAMAANPHRRTQELIITLSEHDGAQIIELIDNGTGIAPEIADRLFDPFTSTKPEGMGIGLNICRSIVEIHRGRLAHRANPLGGTIFTVSLPSSEAKGAAS